LIFPRRDEGVRNQCGRLLLCRAWICWASHPKICLERQESFLEGELHSNLLSERCQDRRRVTLVLARDDSKHPPVAPWNKSVSHICTRQGQMVFFCTEPPCRSRSFSDAIRERINLPPKPWYDHDASRGSRVPGQVRIKEARI
jgi:hypothetical protein